MNQSGRSGARFVGRPGPGRPSGVSVDGQDRAGKPIPSSTLDSASAMCQGLDGVLGRQHAGVAEVGNRNKQNEKEHKVDVMEKEDPHA